MNNIKTVEALNMLVEINSDRIDGYKKAIEETNDFDLKSLFSNLINTSQINKFELSNELLKYVQSAVEGTSTLSKAYKIWMDLMVAIKGNSKLAILKSCEWGGEVAIETYDKALSLDRAFLNEDQIKLIAEQLKKIRLEHDTIKIMVIELERN